MRNLDRYRMALQLRREGRTYKEVGICLGVGMQRAREMVLWMEREERRKPTWYEGLDPNIAGWLMRSEKVCSERDLRDLVENGELLRVTQIGHKSYDKIVSWLNSKKEILIGLRARRRKMEDKLDSSWCGEKARCGHCGVIGQIYHYAPNSYTCRVCGATGLSCGQDELLQFKGTP